LPPIEKEVKDEQHRAPKLKKIKVSGSKKTETTLEAVGLKKKTKKRQPGSFGTLTFPDGSVYEGQLKKGMPHGQGYKKWPTDEDKKH